MQESDVKIVEENENDESSSSSEQPVNVEVGAFWKRKSESGSEYYTGKIKDSLGDEHSVFASMTKRVEPENYDVSVRLADKEGGEEESKTIGGLQFRYKKDGEPYFYGQILGQKVVGWKNKYKEENDKLPNVKLYLSRQRSLI
jgi:uncharacterized protein (DUF736 family)